jgi:hypothetical protein
VQNSIVEPGKWWRVKQTVDSIDPKSPDYNELSRYAKTIRPDNQTWGDVPAKDESLAHADNKMTCFACHSSWMTSCFGCHLSMKANRKMPNRHNEGDDSRNYTTYNFQVLRDDVFMLAKDGTVTGHRVAPAASRSAVLVSSQNQNREWIYSQQQTISAEGFQRPGFLDSRPAHRPRDRDERLYRLPRRQRQQQQRVDGATPDAGDELRQLHGTLRLRRRRALARSRPRHRTRRPQAVFGSTLHKIAYPTTIRSLLITGAS